MVLVTWLSIANSPDGVGGTKILIVKVAIFFCSYLSIGRPAAGLFFLTTIVRNSNFFFNFVVSHYPGSGSFIHSFYILILRANAQFAYAEIVWLFIIMINTEWQ